MAAPSCLYWGVASVGSPEKSGTPWHYGAPTWTPSAPQSASDVTAACRRSARWPAGPRRCGSRSGGSCREAPPQGPRGRPRGLCAPDVAVGKGNRRRLAPGEVVAHLGKVSGLVGRARARGHDAHGSIERDDLCLAPREVSGKAELFPALKVDARGVEHGWCPHRGPALRPPGHKVASRVAEVLVAHAATCTLVTGTSRSAP